MALANYAVSGLGEKTACVELNGHRELAHWKAAGAEGYFVDQGVCFYPDFQKERIPILLNQNYDRIILDFGDAYLSCREEILRCDRKVFLLSLSAWQKFAAGNLIRTVQNEDWARIRPLYASVNTPEAERKAAEREFRIPIMKIPVIEQPHCVKAEEFSCLDIVLERNAAEHRRKKLLIPPRRKA